MTHQHCWVTTDPTGGDPWMGGPVTIVVCADCGREQMDRPNAYEQGQRDALARLEAYLAGCECPHVDGARAAIKGDQP